MLMYGSGGGTARVWSGTLDILQGLSSRRPTIQLRDTGPVLATMEVWACPHYTRAGSVWAAKRVTSLVHQQIVLGQKVVKNPRSLLEAI